MIELPDKNLLTAEEVARLLGVSRRTVYHWNETGWLIGERWSPRTLRFDRGQVEEFIRERWEG